MQASEFSPSVLGGEAPIDGHGFFVAFTDVGLELASKRGFIGGNALRRHMLERTANSISAMLSQLPCLGV